MENKQAYTLLYDGNCPFCRTEIETMKRLDRNNELGFIDITEDEFQAADYGCEQGALMSQIHAVDGEGNIDVGVQVFRKVYGKLGLGWLVNWTDMPILSILADKAYAGFARYRIPAGNLILKLTGRGSGQCK